MTGPSVFLSGSLPPCPEPFNAAKWCVGEAGADRSDAFLAVDPDAGVLEQWDFAELRKRVLVAAGAFRRAGVRPREPVLLCLGDVPAFPVVYFGAIAAGAIAAPLSSQLSDPEVSAIVEAVEPRLIVGGPHATIALEALAEGVEGEFVPRHPDDPALLVFTSGSSGRPKGVLHAQRAFWARQSMQSGWHGIGPADRVMHAGAFNWTYTLGVGLADTWRVGATAILNAGRRTPDVWPALARTYSPTVFAAAPAVYRRILKYGVRLQPSFKALRHGVSAGEALAPSIAQAWTAQTGKPLLEALGMSEVSTYVSTSPDHIAEEGIAGWPQPGRKVAVLDDQGAPVRQGAIGTLAVHRSDPGLFLRYWKDETQTRHSMRGDWFLTGDRVSMREDGAIAFVGRADDLMNAQGYRVDPNEVEAEILRCSGVSDCGVRAIEVDAGLSVIAAWLVVEDGAALNREGVLQELRSRLAAYKCPREFFVVQALPRTANGKIMRRKLAVDPTRRL